MNTGIKKIICLAIFLWPVMLPFLIQAQDLLPLQEVITGVVKENLDVELEQYDAEIASNNVYRGNAGQLPTVELQGSYDYNYNIRQNIDAGEFAAPGGDFALGGDNLVSTTLQSAVTVNYVLFNGFQGRYQYQKLQTQNEQAQKQLEAVMQDVVVEALELYLEVARHQAQLGINEESIVISQERLQRNEIAKEFGGVNQLEVLQAQVDLNEDSIDYDNTSLAYQQAKQRLAELLYRPPAYDFIVEENIRVRDEPFDYPTLQQQALAENATLQVSKYEARVAYQEVKIEDAQRFPTLNASAGMNYNRQQTEQGFPETQETFGPSVGLSLNYTLYDGKQRKVSRKNARLTYDRYETQLKETTRQVEAELSNTYREYENYRGQLRKTQANLANYERNFQKAKEEYELGTTTGTELRNAQVNLVNAKNRIVTLTFDLKLAETHLLKLSGQLMSEN